MLTLLGGCAGGTSRAGSDDLAQANKDAVAGVQAPDDQSYRDLFKPRARRTVPHNAIDPNVPIISTGGAAESGSAPSALIDVFAERGGSANAPKPTPAPAPPAATAKAGEQGWTVILAAFRGDDAVASAASALQSFAAVPELAGAFMERRGESVIVGIGRFAQPGDAAAQELLKAVKATRVGDRQPFAGAFMSPPDVASLAGSMPQFNLRSAKAQFGKAARYTLQVAVYGPADIRATPTAEELTGIRQDAEAAVAKLRREGEQAFYFHGTTKSTVTIGLFEGSDGASQTDTPELKALRKRFPLNLYNGGAIKTRTAGKEQLQPSLLVGVPEK